MEREKSIVPAGPLIHHDYSPEVIDQVDRPPKRRSAWTPIIIAALVGLAGWAAVWKMNVGGFQPVIAAAIASVSASATSAIASLPKPEPQAQKKAVQQQAKAKSEPKEQQEREQATPGLDALIAKLNRWLME